VATRRLEAVLARRIRELADARGLALTHVADLAGLSRGHFWRILDAEHTTTLEIVQRVAKVLRLDPLDLLDPSRPAPRKRR
jgi:transcriptional regulator with XRE-family HTH domain